MASPASSITGFTTTTTATDNEDGIMVMMNNKTDDDGDPPRPQKNKKTSPSQSPAPAAAAVVCMGRRMLFVGILLMLSCLAYAVIVLDYRQVKYLLGNNADDVEQRQYTHIKLKTETQTSHNNDDGDDHHHQQQQQSVDPVLQQAALDFVLKRKQAYEKLKMRHWHMRGIGYLYSEHNMILTATVPASRVYKAGRNQIVLTNSHPNAATAHTNCDRWTIWVRVMGPEIFAGSAQAVVAAAAAAVDDNNDQHCHWIFPFDLQVPGTYQVDAKVLLYNAKGDFTEEMMCPYILGDLPREIEQQFPQRAAFQGFKLYIPQNSCCELCSRQPGCRYWASPPQNLQNPAVMRNGCEFRFDASYPDDLMPKSFILGDIEVDYYRPHRRLDVQHYHGPPHGKETAYFAGCGWSQIYTLDFPCLRGDVDDTVFMLQDSFTFEPAIKTITRKQQQRQQLPLCSLEQEAMNRSHGRWVVQPWPSSEDCPLPMKVNKDFKSKFEIMEFDPDRPHCWHRDDLSRIGLNCVEMNCRYIQDDAKVKTRLKKEKEWLGVWRQYDCDYTEYTNQQLQQCINEKRLSTFVTEGRSVAAFIKEYFDFRLAPLELFRGADGKKVIVSTLSLLHKTAAPDTSLARPELEAMPPVPNNTEYFIVSGFYLSSERETHGHVERIMHLSLLAEEILVPKGYQFINVFDVSTAMTYDTATQMDGMHLIGPTMKMLLTKIFHYLCHDVVEGSRV